LKIQYKEIALSSESAGKAITLNTTAVNTLAHILYLVITFFITVRVGLIFYNNGRLFILNLLHRDMQLTDFINKALLVGYYLLNLGYATLMFKAWEPVQSWQALVLGLSTMTGKILITLAVIHFCNMTAIYFFSKRDHHSIHS
jgi:hypothetical protein